jgi:hypothetical protein
LKVVVYIILKGKKVRISKRERKEVIGKEKE